VDLLKECPFWQDDGSKCVMKGCHVEPCTEEEVPVFLKASDAVRNEDLFFILMTYLEYLKASCTSTRTL